MGSNDALLHVHGVSPEHTEEEAIAVGKALLVAVAGGAPLSAAEMATFVSIAAAYGATAEVVDAWKKLDATSGAASDHVALTPRLARHLAYEAIRVCRAGGAYGPGEREKAAHAARRLGVTPGVLSSLEGMVEAETALRAARATVEAAIKRRPGDAPASLVAGLSEITGQEAVLRRSRVALLEDDGAP
jgi:hypothetical protein